MKPKVATSFIIIFTLAMMLSANPVMIMPSIIFASPSDDGGGGSSDDGGGGSSDGSDVPSENEQSQEESDSEVPEEETVPETESVLVNCSDGSQTATTEKCPTTTGTATFPTENILWGDHIYVDPVCQTNPTAPACKSTMTTGTNTPGAPPSGSAPSDSGSAKSDICTSSPEAPFCKSTTTAGTTTSSEAPPSGSLSTDFASRYIPGGASSGSVPADTGSEKNDICTKSPEAPFCKSQTIISTVDDSPDATLLLPYFEEDLGKEESDLFSVNNAPCQANPTAPACKSTTTTGSTTPGVPPSGSPPADAGTDNNDFCTKNPEAPFCKSQTTTGTNTFDETQKEADSRFSVGFGPVCPDSNPNDPACKSTTTPGTSTTEPTSTSSGWLYLCANTPAPPECNKTTTESTAPTDTTFYCKANPSSPECNKTPTTPVEVEVPKNKDGTCPPGSHFVAFGGKNGAPSGSKCVSDNPSSKTTTTPTGSDPLTLCQVFNANPDCNKTPTMPVEVEVPKNK
ncbi:MAG TPA: hypothetical protein VJR94_08540, partial [Candidatus Nitrosocosmicus sp.]|nr:hypothetical protein [Candidatus Nitrosocosmicus sp.]